MLSLAGFGYLVALLATIFYCALVWYGGNYFSSLAGLNEGIPVSNFSRMAIVPLDLPATFNMIHWQLLAAGSFLFSLLVTFKNKAVSLDGASAALPLINHYGVLLLMLLINLVGFLVPIIPDCAVIE